MKQKFTDLAIKVRKEMVVELVLRLPDLAMSIPPEWHGTAAAVVAAFTVLVVLVMFRHGAGSRRDRWQLIVR